jgi:predicted nucleotidyltransferase
MHLDATELQKIRDYFKSQPVKKAWIFGSHSRNMADAASDVDILIELDHSKPVGLKFVRMQIELTRILQTGVDLISEKALSKYIRPRVENERVLIYER